MHYHELSELLSLVGLPSFPAYCQKQPPEVFCKKKCSSQNSQENTCARALGLQLYSKRDFEHLFYRTPLDDCFCITEFMKAKQNQDRQRKNRISRRSQMFLKIGVPKNFKNFTEKIPVLESHFNKVVGLRPAMLLKRDSNTDVSCEIFKFFKNTFF